MGNIWRALPLDPKAFRYAWNKEHLMVSFEYDYWVFSKRRPGKRPNSTPETDKLLMACICHVNLDRVWSRATQTVSLNHEVINRGLVISKRFGSFERYEESGPFPLNDYCGYEVCPIVDDSCWKGNYHNDHKQFDTSRVSRTAYHNQSACSALNSGSILSLLGNEATASVWYQQFSQGCKKTMGQDWCPNWAISNELVHLLLKGCKDWYKPVSTFDETADWIIAGTFFVTGYFFCSLCEALKVFWWIWSAYCTCLNKLTLIKSQSLCLEK
jgi:hypothetical protein